MSLKIKPSFYLSSKCIIIFVCFCGFLYQTFELFSDYMSGKTVVSLEVGRKSTEALPAITLCTKNVLGFLNIAKNYPEMRHDVNSYRSLINQFNRERFGPKKSISKQWENDYLQEFASIYKRIESNFDLPSFTQYEIMKNLSIRNIKGRETYVFNWLVGMINHQNKWKFIHTYSDKNRIINKTLPDPIESIIMNIDEQNGLEVKKCFTFFSALQKFWRNFTVKMSLAEIHMRSDYMWMPDHFYFSMHSPNTLPSMTKENFIKLSTVKSHVIYFSQIKTELLGKGYDTNCYEYNIDYKHANFNIRSDCITDCFRKSIQKMCKLSGQPSMTEMIRADWLEQNRNVLFDKHTHCYQNKSNYLISECQKFCQPDCRFSYYLWDMEPKDQGQPSHLLDIKTNIYPDIHIKYSAEITSISFFCSFGGLLGMWAGPSFYGIFTNIIIVLFEILIKPGTLKKKLGSLIFIDPRIDLIQKINVNLQG